jgi:hypothetical protein
MRIYSGVVKLTLIGAHDVCYLRWSSDEYIVQNYINLEISPMASRYEIVSGPPIRTSLTEPGHCSLFSSCLVGNWRSGDHGSCRWRGRVSSLGAASRSCQPLHPHPGHLLSASVFISILIPYTEPLLLSTSNLASSLFMIAMNYTGIRVLPDIVNLVPRNSLCGVGSEELFVASRV